MKVLEKLELIGFGFEDGILGGGGSGGGGYYDYISDKICGYNIDKFDKIEFDKWYDNFSKKDLNSRKIEIDKFEDYNIELFNEIESGIYNLDEIGGSCEVVKGKSIEFFANVCLFNDNDGDLDKFVLKLNEQNEIKKGFSKDEVEKLLINNLTCKFDQKYSLI